jgi:hypothetical protein
MHRQTRRRQKPTCPQPELRAELWQWLDAVVTWLNTDYVWDVANIIPADHTLENVFLILVSAVWFHSVCKIRMHNVQDTT